MAGYEERRDAFLNEGVGFFAGAVDTLEDSRAVAQDLSFPLAYGITREDAAGLGAWWDDKRNFIQPTEFLVTQSGKIMFSTYSNSPVGRMDPDELLTLIQFLSAQRARQKS